MAHRQAAMARLGVRFDVGGELLGEESVGVLKVIP